MHETIERLTPQDEIQRRIRAQYLQGFEAGEHVGRYEANRAARRDRDRAMGVGFLIGVAFGVVLTFVAVDLVFSKPAAWAPLFPAGEVAR